MKILAWFIAIHFALTTVYAVAQERAQAAVQLFNDNEFLNPSSTLEIRFTEAMISREEIGTTAAESPLVLQPKLPGKFTWLSTRSGVFVPTEIPPLGLNFVVSIQPNLRSAAGQPIGENFKAALKTPPFQVVSSILTAKETDSLAADVAERFAFNSAVQLEGAERLFQFINSKGAIIPAKVRYASTQDDFRLEANQGDWAARWQLALKPNAAISDGASEEESPQPLTDRLIISPTTPLATGTRWRLKMLPGLRTLDGKSKIVDSIVVPLGSVEAFKIAQLTPQNTINSGRSFRLEFSAPIAPDLTADTAATYFKIQPAVANLRFESSWESITVRGDFSLGQEYRIEASSSVISATGLPLDGERSRTLTFQPAKPRIYLPTITGHQYLGGKRQFEVRSINLAKLKITARLVDPADIPKAIVAFEKYHKDWDEKDPDESYQAIPSDQVLGKIIAEKTLNLDRGIDVAQTTALDWGDLLGTPHAGAIFLTVEGEPLGEVGGRKPAAQAFMQVTDVGVLWKKMGNAVRVSLFSLSTGKPLADATVGFVDGEFNRQTEQKTNTAGLADLPFTPATNWLLVRNSGDAFALRMGNAASELPMSGFDLPIYYGSWDRTAAQPMRILMFTDRPLYQPGETIRIKGIARHIEEAGLKSAAAEVGTITLFNQRGDQVANLEVTTDAQGAFDGAMSLPAAATGRHTLRVDFESSQGGVVTTLEVANYQPNAFEISNSLPATFSPKETVEARITGKYLFGAPLSKASVRWTLRQFSAAFSPTGFTDFHFPGAEDDPQKSLTLRGEGQLENGRDLVIRPRLPAPKYSPQHGVLTVEVTDINQQTVSNTQNFIRDSSSFYLGIATPGRTVFRAGETFTTRVVAVQPNGQPLLKPVALTAKLIHQRFENVRVQGAGKAISFRTDTIEERVAEMTGSSLSPTLEGAEWKVRDGSSFTCKPTRPGGYRLQVSTTDADGREVLTDWEFYVSGSDDVVWDYRSAQQIDLVPDRADYRSGDTAKILVKSPIAGEALVSIERNDQILRSWKTTLTRNATTLEVPLEALDAPNVFVSVMLVRGAAQSPRKYPMPEYRYGVCLLKITDPASSLQVAVTPVQPAVQPGAEVETLISVRDGLGRPMPGAQVTFSAVDDGILGLTGYQRPMPTTLFSEPIPLAIPTGLNIFDLLPEDPAALTFGNKGYLIGGGGLEGPGTKLRTNLPGTAAWFPSLRTDDQGLIKVKFTAPDAITRYRLVAVAHAKDTYFGSAESSFLIRKPLLLLSSLGQFANVGDQIQARAVVRNETGADGQAEVTLLLDVHGESTSPTIATIPLRQGESKAVDFPVRLTKMGKAEWKWSTRMTTDGQVYQDTVMATLPVGSPSILLRETHLSDLTGKTQDLLQNVNPQLLEGSGSVAVSVSNTRLASLRESVTQLLNYPYGCAEQTVSALIPWLTMATLRPVLPDFQQSDEKIAITAGIAKLFSMQSPSGGIAYWPGGNRTSLFASSYAVIALSLAEKQGYAMPDTPWNNLLHYLVDELRSTQKIRTEADFSDRALALYALAAAGQKQPAYHEQLYAKRTDLSSETRALLALALLESNASTAMVTDLLDTRKPAPEGFSWFGSPARERAIRLLAWSRLKPKSNEVARLVKELLGLRHNGHWGNTQANAWALLALSQYYTVTESGDKNVSATLTFNHQIIPVQVTKSESVKNASFDFTPSQPPTVLRVENPKKGQLFGEARFVVTPPIGQQPRQDRGYAVSRVYQRLENDGKFTETTDWNVGDRVLVTLRVETSSAGHFVAIDDALPAIFEAVNPSFKSQTMGTDVADRDWVTDYREIRADRVLFFCDHLPAGAFTFRYLARVRSAGTVTAPTTKVEEMYRPERFGLSETLQLTSRAQP